MMRFYVRHWYSLNLVAGALFGVVLAADWKGLAVVQRLVLLNVIALIVHQFEEYGFPGGEPLIMNGILQGSRMPDRFPLNAFSAMFTNVTVGALVFLLPVFFPNALWLSLAPMLFNFGQLVVHGILTPIKLKRLYDPGLVSVIFLHLPISIVFIWSVSSRGLITGWDWLWGVLYAVLIALLPMGFMTYVVFASRSTRWVFTPTEMKRFQTVEELKRQGIIGGAMRPARGPVAVLGRLQRKLHHE